MSSSTQRKRHTPEQIIVKLREAEAMRAGGKSIAPVCQHLEVSEVTWHRWKSQYGGMKADAMKRLKELEEENGYAESFHSRLRDERLNAERFTSLAEAKPRASLWRLEYNHRRPHRGRGYLTPAAFACSCAAAPSAALREQPHTNTKINPLYFHSRWYREWGQVTALGRKLN